MKYNDISLNLKKLFGRVLAVLLCLSAIFFAACSQSEQESGDGEQPTVTEETDDYISASRGYGQGGLICTPEAFAAAKDGWFRSDGKISKLLSDEANAASLTEVVAGETYCYVYSCNLLYESLPENYQSHNLSSLETFRNFFVLGIVKDETVHYGESAVTFGEFSYEDFGGTLQDSRIQYGTGSYEGNYISISINYDKEVKVAFCIEFTPLFSGQLCIEHCWLYEPDSISVRLLPESVIFAQVFADAGEQADRNEVAIADFSSAIQRSENKVEISFRMTPKFAGADEDYLYCDLYVRENSSFHITVEEVSTAQYSSVPFSDGTIYRIGYRVPESADTAQDVKIALLVLATGEGNGIGSLDISLYGYGVRPEGRTRDSLSISAEDFTDGGTSEEDSYLTYRELSNQQYVVTGLKDKSVTEIVLPDTYNGFLVTGIRSYAFQNTFIESVTIGNSVQSIGDRAFYNCQKLESITFGERVQSIGDEAFYQCVSLTEPSFAMNLEEIGDYAFYECRNLGSFTFGAQVAEIGEYAFAESYLTSVHLQKNVESVGKGAFANCKRWSSSQSMWISSQSMSLQEISVSESNPFYTSVKGVLFTKDMSVLVAYPMAKTGSSYSIPEGVEKVEESAFYQSMSSNNSRGYSPLRNIVISATVSEIGAKAFYSYAEYDGGMFELNGFSSLTFPSDTNWTCEGEDSTESVIVTAEMLADPAAAADLYMQSYSDCIWLRSNG